MRRCLHASWVWAMVMVTASTADLRARHPYCPGWERPMASQWALTIMAATFSTILPRQFKRLMTL